MLTRGYGCYYPEQRTDKNRRLFGGTEITRALSSLMTSPSMTHLRVKSALFHPSPQSQTGLSHPWPPLVSEESHLPFLDICSEHSHAAQSMMSGSNILLVSVRKGGHFRSRHTAKPASPEPRRSIDVGSGTPDTTPPEVIWLLTANDKMFPRASTSTTFIPPVLVKILCEKLPLTSALTSPRLCPNGVTVMPDSL